MTKNNENEDEEQKKKNKKTVEKENLESSDLEFDSEGLHIQDGKDALTLDACSTGSLGLDVLSGGFSSGVMQLWGPPSIGKTSLLLMMAGEFQAKHKYHECRVYLWLTEGRWNPRLLSMAPKLKMESPTELIDGTKKARSIFRLCRPKSGEKMYDFILRTIKNDKIRFMHIIDSSDGIKCEANEGKTMSAAEKTAATASLNTKFLREASVYVSHHNHILAYTNQVRDKISTGGPSHVSGVGKQKSGGNSIQHYSSFSLDFDKLWTDLYIYENPNDTKSKIIGHIMSAKLEKVSNSGNRLSKAQIPFIYDHGIDREREIATLSEAYGLIKRKGAWFEMNGENIAQGQVKFIQLLKENKELSSKLEVEIRKLSGLTI